MLNILSINLLYLHCIKSIVYGETDYQGNYCGTPKEIRKVQLIRDQYNLKKI